MFISARPQKRAKLTHKIARIELLLSAANLVAGDALGMMSLPNLPPLNTLTVDDFRCLRSIENQQGFSR